MLLSLRALAARSAVAIPAKNEADHILPCLHALAAQTLPPGLIVLCVNNTTDDTVAVARSVPLPPGTRLHVLERTLPAALAYAGAARRLAMDEASRLVGPDGVVLTTDADGVADTTWLEANLRILQGGVDAVAGWVDLDVASWHAIPRRLHDDDARECAYDALCDEIAARLDPDPADPLPRHTQNSGASIALWSAVYAMCGGVPPLRQGEDRALIDALRRIDARIRHAPECHVTVSGRTEGRAAGGMAETIRRRLTAPDPYLDDRLEPAASWARRCRLRAALRACTGTPALLPVVAAELALDLEPLGHALAACPFGTVWAAVEAHSPTLIRQKVAVAELPEQMRAAQAICDQLRVAARSAPVEAAVPRTEAMSAQGGMAPAVSLAALANLALGGATRQHAETRGRAIMPDHAHAAKANAAVAAAAIFCAVDSVTCNLDAPDHPGQAQAGGAMEEDTIRVLRPAGVQGCIPPKDGAPLLAGSQPRFAVATMLHGNPTHQPALGPADSASYPLPG